MDRFTKEKKMATEQLKLGEVMRVSNERSVGYERYLDGCSRNVV